MQDIALDIPAPIADRLTARKLAAGFHIDMHGLRFDEGWIDRDRNRGGIIHGRAGRPELRRQVHQILQNRRNEIVNRAVGLGEFVEVVTGEERFVANLESHHRQRPSCLKDDLCGFRIVIDVGFSGGIHVAPADGAAHQNDFLHQRDDGRIFLDGEGDVRERPYRHERNFMRRFVHKLNDQIGTKTRVHLALAGRQFDIRQSILAMPELGGDQLLKQRMPRSSRHWNIAPLRQRDHPQRVLEPHVGGHVSRDHGDRAHVEFSRVQREHERQRVVRSRVGVKDDLLRRRGGNREHRQHNE